MRAGGRGPRARGHITGLGAGEQIKSIASNNVLPHNRVSNKEEFVNSSNLQSVLFKVLRGVYLLSLNIGQWRRKCEVDSISKPQLQIGFKQSWKLCLNLCSRKWLRPTRSRVISLIRLRLSQSKTFFEEGYMTSIILSDYAIFCVRNVVYGTFLDQI